MGRRLAIVGLSHRTAPLEVREKMAFPLEQLGDACKTVCALPGVGEAMIVSTCNRVEIYAGLDGDLALPALEQFLVENRGLPGELRAHLYRERDDEALRHLFRVAAALDSMVVGESQILGQVKEAYAIAQDAGTLGPLLRRALPRAFQLAKRVRTETEVAKNARSVASAAVDLATQIFGALSGCRVLVIGAGKMGQLSARHLRSAGVRELVVLNRTEARAVELARRLGGRAAPFSELDHWLASVDIVLSSTGAAEPVLRKERVAKVMRARKGRWLFVIDIAVPRDVEPEVGQIENVYLYDVDALDQVVAQNRDKRAGEADKAESLVDAEMARYRERELALGVVPTIKLLRGHFLAVARSEVERTLQRGGDRDRSCLEAMAEAIVNKLLHEPLTRLKRDATVNPDSELPALVRTLFDLHPADAEELQLESGDEQKKAVK